MSKKKAASIMAKLWMGLREPCNQKIKAAFPALRTDIGPPAGPVLNQPAKPDQGDDFIVRSIFQQAPGSPILVEPAQPAFSMQDFTELFRIDIVIPDVRKIAGNIESF